MNRAKRLAPLVELAKEKTRDATLAMAQAQKAFSALSGQLNILEEYSKQYDTQLHADGESGMAAYRLQQHKHFVGELGIARENLRVKVEEMQIVLNEKRQIWLTYRQRERSLEKVAEKFIDAQRTFETRLEQKQQDEIARRQSRANPEK